LDYSINTPYTTNKHIDIDGIIEVTNQTEDEKLIENAYTLAHYFMREFDYGSTPFPCKGITKIDDTALLFTENDIDKTAADTKECSAIYGECFFNKVNIFPEHGERWVLKWVWLHPFFRNRGRFSKLWPILEKKFGDFYIDKPISADMRKFLDRVESKHLEFNLP